MNASLRQIYSSSSNGASSEESDTRMTTKTCSRAPFESDVQPAKRVALQDGRSPERPQACGRIPLMTSTPYREQGGQGIDSPTDAVSPIAQSIDRELPINDETCEDQNVNTKTSVQVRVEWPSKTKVNNLYKGLESHTHLFLAKLLFNILLVLDRAKKLLKPHIHCQSPGGNFRSTTLPTPYWNLNSTSPRV